LFNLLFVAPYWREIAVNEFIRKWNFEVALPSGMDPVNKDDMEFIKPFGVFKYSDDKSTRYVDADFCETNGFTIEQHLDKVIKEATNQRYGIFILPDVNLDDLPANQVELLLTMFETPQFMNLPSNYAKVEGKLVKTHEL
jgi:hypothetical protein